VISDFPLFRPASRALYKRLDRLAASGDFDINLLDQLRLLPETQKSRFTVYYLASLYLQLGDESTARDMLSSTVGWSPAIKKFYCVLSFCRQSLLPVPKLNAAEENCADYLDTAINPPSATIEQKLSVAGGFSIVGNAPGAALKIIPAEWCKFYFNSYLKNSRITDDASIHVVTPSWRMGETVNSSSLCITGNSIFHRRSSVWRKFIANEYHPAVYTVPRHLWRTLYTELGTSPSAGLLIVGLVAEIAARNPKNYSGYIAGFSFGLSDSNHDYDSEPASKRHNWSGEAIILRRLIGELENNCLELTVDY